MDYNEYGWVKASEYRQNTLLSLANKPKTPKDISQEHDYQLSHSSQTLSDLEDRGLVECATPDRHKGRLYIPTDKGEEMIDLLEK